MDNRIEPWSVTLGFPSLRERRRVPEIIDQPDLSPERLVLALQGLRRIHALTGGARLLWPSIQRLAQSNRGETLRLLDLATGGGDIPIGLWKVARRAGIPLRIEGCDISAQAVEYAKKRAYACRADVQFFVHNVLDEDFPPGYDIIISSLFLHHLDDAGVVALLKRSAQNVSRMLLMHDLVRHPVGYALAKWGSRLVLKSEVVHHDAPLSVAAAFTIAEIRELANRAGLVAHRVEKRFPYRFLLSWTRP